jgi:hypothetical protein
MNKTVTALILAVVFMFVASISSASKTTLSAGQTGVCIQASWVAYNQDEEKDTQLQFNVGPIGYGWGKNVTRTLAPGGFQANAIAQKTVFKNKSRMILLNPPPYSNTKFRYKLIEHVENVEENKVGYFIKNTEINFELRF